MEQEEPVVLHFDNSPLAKYVNGTVSCLCVSVCVCAVCSERKIHRERHSAMVDDAYRVRERETCLSIAFAGVSSSQRCMLGTAVVTLSV